MTVEFSELILALGIASFDCGEHGGTLEEYREIRAVEVAARTALESAIQALVKERDELKAALVNNLCSIEESWFACRICEEWGNTIPEITHAPDCIVRKYEAAK